MLNRINTAASLGVAIILVGCIRFLGSVVHAKEWRGVIESCLVAMLCATGFLINNTLASFWISAYQEQTEVLADIMQHFPSMPHGTTLVLDGVCPYKGPGVVFECFWDLGSALQLLYHDSTLKGDVVSPRLKVDERGLVTRIYSYTAYYPYSRNLMMYNYRRKVTERLIDAKTAGRYFETVNPTHGYDCPPGVEGYGVPIF